MLGQAVQPVRRRHRVLAGFQPPCAASSYWGRFRFRYFAADVANVGSAPYLAHNPDVAAARIDPLQHYEAYGWKEGRARPFGLVQHG